MPVKKDGFPEENELVMCTVTKVQFHSVFASLDEYHKGGMIHISEVSPGRIRNIRDFVKEGKKVVCKVLKINQEKGHIDLSLRRVTEREKRTKVDELKKAQLAEKMIEFVAKDTKQDGKKLFQEISAKLLQKYDSVYDFFQALVAGDADIKETGASAAVAKKLEEVIKSRIKESTVTVDGKLKLISFADDGVEVIKAALKKAEDAAKDTVSIKYLGSGTYGVSVVAKDYKQAEKMLKQVTEPAIEYVQKHDGSGEFVRTEA